MRLSDCERQHERYVAYEGVQLSGETEGKLALKMWED
jgi:hypothetical protein